MLKRNKDGPKELFGISISKACFLGNKQGARVGKEIAYLKKRRMGDGDVGDEGAGGGC